MLGLMIAASTMMNAQTVNGVLIKDINAEYIQIIGTGKPMSTKFYIQIDFGQQQKSWKSKDTHIINKEGKLLQFKGMMDALNFMNKYGYELDQVYFSNVGALSHHYILKRKALIINKK